MHTVVAEASPPGWDGNSNASARDVQGLSLALHMPYADLAWSYFQIKDRGGNLRLEACNQLARSLASQL